MDSVIAKIVELDQQAQNVKEKINEIESKNNEKLKKTLQELDSRVVTEAKKIGQEKYQSLVQEGQQHKEKVAQETKKERDELEDFFNNKFENLMNSIFCDIFKV